VLTSLNQVVIAERHGKTKPGSTGIAIDFPNSTLYRSPYTGMQSYTILAERFSRASLWDDFLVYHYSDREFAADAVEPVVPSSGGITRAPGSGNITISELTASANSVTPGESIQLSAVISGNNVGYITYFAGIYDAASSSIYVADTDYLESAQTAELNGVYYPVWPESDSFRINLDWEPTLFSITDGTQSSLALFNPVSFGARAEDAVYAVEGTYTFTIAQKWMEVDSSGAVSQTVYEDGDTLTMTDVGFAWEQVYAPAGQYIVGFMVSDLDGNLKQAFTQVTVQ
jgi:hypothetical protein